MAFTVICNECGFEQEFNNGDSHIGDHIEISLTEDCDVFGCIVESIDICCDNCDNEASL